MSPVSLGYEETHPSRGIGRDRGHRVQGAHNRDTDRRRIGAQRVLHVRQFGSGPPLVALHGFTLTGEQFAGSLLCLDRTVYAPDLPGHGFSAGISPAMPSTIGLIADVLESTDGDAPLLGYSQGGRIAVATAIERPEVVPSLILVSTSPGIEDTTLRTERAAADRTLATAMRSVTIDGLLDTWTTRGLTDTSHLPEDVRQADRAVREQNTPMALAAALEGLGQGSQEPVWNRLHELKIPVLILYGENDHKYGEYANTMAGLIPEAVAVSISGAGHNPLLDAPDLSYERISGFLDRFG